MSKHERLPKPGIRQADGLTGMSSAACDIAISELADVPQEQICGYIVLVVSHPARSRGHELRVIPSDDNWEWAARWLKTAARDVEASHP